MKYFAHSILYILKNSLNTLLRSYFKCKGKNHRIKIHCFIENSFLSTVVENKVLFNILKAAMHERRISWYIGMLRTSSDTSTQHKHILCIHFNNSYVLNYACNNQSPYIRYSAQGLNFFNKRVCWIELILQKFSKDAYIV